MRYFGLITCFLIVCQSNSQTILNGNFETFIYCPPSWGPDLTIAQTMDGWLSVTGSADGIHNSCPPLDPENMEFMPPMIYGDGYGGVFGRSEAMSHEILGMFEPGLLYEFGFEACYAEISWPIPEEYYYCSRICIYGSMQEPPLNDPWSLIYPSAIPELHLLGCSETVTELASWDHFSILFTPDSSYGYLTITMLQDESCIVNPYIAIDNLQLGVHVTEIAEQSDNTSFLVYPNPFNGLLNVAVQNFAASEWQLADVSGRLVDKRNWQPGSVNTLDLSHLESGIYMLKVINSDGTEVFQELIRKL